MGSKKSFVKGLAAGAVIAAAASLMLDMQKGEGKRKAAQLKKAASDIGKKVAAHAVRLGAMSKSSYDRIVDTAVAEYRGAKALSQDDLRELKAELRGGFAAMKSIVKKPRKK